MYYVPVVLLLLLPIFLSPSLSLCLCSGVPHTISPFLYLPFFFFAATTKCLYKQHLLPASLLAIIILRCDHGSDSLHAVILLLIVVDSHIQRIVLATEETTVTQQVSHRPIKRQSRLWSQRGTKVNGSHHGDNPLLRPTGIQIATKSYAALQAMAPTNIKTVHNLLTPFESNLDRLGMLSPTHDQRSQQKTGKITLQPVLINKSKFLKATHFVQK